MINQDILKNKNDLLSIGYFFSKVELPAIWKEYINNEEWNILDNSVEKYLKESDLSKLLSTYCDYQNIEFIISIRDAKNEWEEDGIWHDDGSRKLAFSLSLNQDFKNIKGGVLEIRKKGTKHSQKIPSFEWARVVIFATGELGFEHKINKVTHGKRIIIAGWCS